MSAERVDAAAREAAREFVERELSAVIHVSAYALVAVADHVAAYAARVAEEERRKHEHLQRCLTLLSQAISHRTTEHIRKQFRGNTPECINAETDELTVLFAEFAALRARAAGEGEGKPCG